MTASPVSSLQAIAEEFARQYLSAYTDTLRASHARYARKEVNDALWGTILLTPVEVAILDSPLLQRLRFIRQLGVVHWLYPGAVHTRFEHTLGVLFQVQQLISSFNSAAALDRPEQRLIDANQTQLLRICALLHDVGHAAFSHVSERALEELPELAAAARNFSQQRRGEDKQLSEILAYYIVRSPAMQQFLEVLINLCGPDLKFNSDSQENIQTIVNKASSALVGEKIDDRIPLLHELISGPFDADKLDYLVRDARSAGTPSLLDIPRLMQKLSVRRMQAKDLPQEIGGQSSLQAQDEAWLSGIKWSGMSVLDELQLARVLVRAKIYRHSKVIALEQMLRAFIQTVAKLAPAERILHFLFSHADDAILSMGATELVGALALSEMSLVGEQRELLSNAVTTLRAIKERRLWARAFQFSNFYPLKSDMAGGREGLDCARRSKSEPPCRPNFEPGLEADFSMVGCA